MLLTILHFAVENYEVTVYTGNAFMAGTDARIYVELFGESRNSGEVELAGKKSAFARGRYGTTYAFKSHFLFISSKLPV